MITVACTWVQGNVPYTADYVVRLRSMLRRHGQNAWHFVCLTDRPKALPFSLDTIKIPTPQGMPGWWSKLQLFNREHGLSGPVLHLDLDTLVVRKLDWVHDLYEAQVKAALVPHAGTFEGRDGKRVVTRYNSSVMYFNSIEEHHGLWDEWTPEVAEDLWGDQDWLGANLLDAQLLPLEWFPRLSEIQNSVPPASAGQMPPDAKIILCKKPKNHMMAARYAWFNRMWQ